MSTVTQIITDAFRQSNLVAVGVEPTAAEQTEALRYLGRIVRSVFGNEAGEQLVPFPIGDTGISRPSGYPGWDQVPDNDWFVPKNTKIVANIDSSVNLFLHPIPNNGSRFGVIDVQGNFATYPVTVTGNGRLIQGAQSIVLDVNSTNSEWFYRDDLASWLKYAPIVIDDTFPFPEEFDDYFISMLAMRLNPSYGVMIDQQSSQMMIRSKTQLRARYKQEEPMMAEIGLLRLSKLAIDRDQWGDNYWPYNPNSMFEKGWPW